jgi:predicted ATPase/DNA-binding XRE family transcriptional regulator
MNRELSFGAWIKKRRTILGLSRDALAEQVGYSVAMLRKIEGDERRPSEKAAALLAKALAIPPEQEAGFLKVARQESTIDHLDEPGEEGAFPWQTVPQPQTNLPVPPTLFVGRDKELARLTDLLEDPACHLVTLVGLAGIGKTRLSVQAAHRHMSRFADGVFFVSLASLASHKMIGAAIGNAIGLEFRGGADPEEHLLFNLQKKRMLLVLDNFEHLIEGAGFLAEIIQTAPGIQLLVSSRERLNLQGEWVFEVPGLPYPVNPRESSLEQAKAYESVQLFLQSALRANPRFTLNEANWKDVSRICSMLEGMPLGIELAAAWVRVLSCQEIANEIKKNLDFLRSSARDVPERHRSLRAALDHSWELLSLREKAVFSRLAVFGGGFCKEAAREVAGADLEEITSLLDKSLLKRVGEKRYDLHELVRQYTNTHLQSDTQQYTQTRDRHSTYYAALLEKWAGRIRSPKQVEILADMETEMDNVRRAWNWMVAHRQTDDIKRSLRGLWHFHEIRARFWEGAALFGEGVAALEWRDEAGVEQPAQRLALMGQVQAQQGYFLAHLDRYEEAGELLHQSVAVLRSNTDRVAFAEALTYLAYMKYRMSAFVESRQYAQESLDINRALDNQLGIVFCLVILSYIHLAESDYEQAYTLSSESLAICRAVLGDPHGTADCLITLTAAARRLGRHAQARQWAEEGLEISKALNDRWGMAQTLRQLGILCLELGETEQAENLLRQSVAKSREVCDLTLMATVFINLGVVAGMKREAGKSKQYFLEALKAAMQTKSFVVARQALVELAEMEKRDGNAESALELAIYIAHHSSSHLDVTNRAEHLFTELITKFTTEQVEVIRAQAQTKTLETLTQELLTAGS